MNRGYIKVWRKVWNHKLFQEKRKFSRFEAWVDMIMLANGKDKEIIFDGKSLLIKRGQFLTSQRQLAARWGWSKTKTADFLKISSKHDHSIEIISDRKKSIITILNYEKYNPLPRGKKTTEIESKKTTERPQKDHRLVPTNKDKRKNNSQKILKKEYFDLVDLLIERMRLNDPRARVLNTERQREEWANDFKRLIERDGRSMEEVREVLIWCQEDSFWRGNILSASKLRKQFTQLKLKKEAMHKPEKPDPAELTRKEMKQ
jgi:hypothetical protein